MSQLLKGREMPDETSHDIDERRMVHRFIRHWREAQSREGRIPSLDALTAIPLEDEIESALFLVQVHPGQAPTIIRLGRAFLEDGCADLVGGPISALPEKSLLAQALHFHRLVLAKSVPITLGGKYKDAQGKAGMYRSVVMPLSNLGQETDHLIGAANGKPWGGEA